jgi:leucyl/phenylalanyl-tRNA---protein transferase
MHGLPLTPDALVAAYANAIFPMDVEGAIRWFSPDPRAIIELDAFHEPKNLAQLRRSGRFEIRIDTAFEEVMRACADRPEGTWISEPIIRVYGELHRRGVAHSVESWREGALEGGLYGVALGGVFFGESMFYRSTDASKVALAALVERLRTRGYQLLDVQFLTPHLATFGAIEISRDDYTRRLREALGIDARFVD